MNTAFKQAVEEYLEPSREQFNYTVLLNNHLDSSRFQPWIEQLAEYRSVEGARVLSSGCGSGGDLETFLKTGAAHATGIEVDSGLSSLAKKRFAGSAFEDRVEILTYAGDYLPLPDAGFDIVFSMHVIEHTKNVALYLAELLRVLKPGGIIFLELPNRYYKYEQHINLPYIHHLPRRLRNRLVSSILGSRFSAKLDGTMRFKIGTMYEYYIPSPKSLVRSLLAQPAGAGFTVVDALFHSHSLDVLPYAKARLGYYFGNARRYTTFRLIIGKTRT